MTKVLQAAAAALLSIGFIPRTSLCQEREVQDTPKRYREFLKDPRTRAALTGEEPSRTFPARTTPSGRAGKEGKKAEKGPARKGKEFQERGGVPSPPRLVLPPPAEARPPAGRFPRGEAGRRQATPPPMGDDSLWPWNPSLVGSGGRGRKKGIEEKGSSSPTREEALRRKEDTGGRTPSVEGGGSFTHDLFGGEDQPGLFLTVEKGRDGGVSPPGEKGAVPGEERPGGPGAGRGRPSLSPEEAGKGSFFASPPPLEGRSVSPGKEEPARGGLPPRAPRKVAPPVENASLSPPPGKEDASRVLERMFLALGGLKAFRDLGGIHAEIRITAYDRMGAEVFSRAARQEAWTGQERGDRISFSGGEILGRKGDAVWAVFRGVERPDMAAPGAGELEVLSFFLRFPFSLADRGRFVPVAVERVKGEGGELLKSTLRGPGGEAVLYLEPTTCIPREVVYTPPRGKRIRVLLSEWRNLRNVVLPSRKAVLSADGKRVSLEIRVLEILAGFRWGGDHFLPPAKTP